ncbi:MAG: hypothetical protein IPM29_02165 [Planctomycetes bacterium]|nr:hypothetical protein [Planctomycetota bacterium]
MSIAAVLLASFAVAAGCPQQPAPGSPAEPEHVTPDGFARHRDPLFAIDLPAHWRAVTPDESLDLQRLLPADVPRVQTGRVALFGDVDRWLAGDFDGRYLLALVASDFEAPEDDRRLATLRRHWEETTFAGGARREVLAGRVATVGLEAHPCVELELLGLPDAVGRRDRALEIYASTAGHELILGFRCFADDWDAAADTLRRMAASLAFARPAAPPERLGDRLTRALTVGAIVGLALLGLRHLARARRPGGPAAGPGGRGAAPGIDSRES